LFGSSNTSVYILASQFTLFELMVEANYGVVYYYESLLEKWTFSFAWSRLVRKLRQQMEKLNAVLASLES
jgi:hypothetical protein